MNPSYKYTALLDVLSFRFRLDQDISTGDYSLKNDLEGALSIFDSVDLEIFGVQAISDTIIMTCSSHERFEEFLNILKTVYIVFLNKGLYVRGGVAYSRHYQSGRLTYSHALAKAYEIESKIAIYPRIMIDKNIIDMYKGGASLPDIFGKNLLAQHNGGCFINVLDQDNWCNVYGSAAAMYKKDKLSLINNEAAFAKHQWFENYLFASPHADLTQIKYIEGTCLI